MKKTVSLKSTKEAALYFEHVLPFDAILAARSPKSSSDGTVLSATFPYEDRKIGEKVAKSLLPKLANHTEIIYKLLGFQAGMLTYAYPPKLIDQEGVDNLREVIAYFEREWGVSFSTDDFTTKSDRTRQIIAEKSYSYLSEIGFHDCPTWNTANTHESDGNQPNSFEVTISGLNLVNADSLSWDEIIEFRKDEDSWSNLRDLRLFFTENFDGKDADYVQDKLLQLLDRQERTAKRWKFETVQKSLSVALTNQSTILSSMAGLAAAVGGAPLTVAAGAALVVPMGNCALEFSKALIDSSKEKLDRPTKFLSQLKKLNR
jgi:hypothetical protein